ncbi:hypothetical protein HXA34_11320 [Salipaludibacillus agaradhaerens]|uniref:hypothetical protein n=1 Tax=Salipaludibacillus agaradhaerens TaxID=76935 RepID=UPI0021510176|nr:hypothetical protein [Salipaludibacillus agaradhaerens]MCR6106878.1 hypothetical protein [Salipaludibacillus agaradhaerens]MCR6118910.1 hypothetical protein [Salipaludibacillus agaradhaerens]
MNTQPLQTALTLKETKQMRKQDISCPDEFLDYKWVDYLPFYTHGILPTVALYAFDSKNKAQCIENIKLMVSEEESKGHFLYFGIFLIMTIPHLRIKMINLSFLIRKEKLKEDVLFKKGWL